MSNVNVIVVVGPGQIGQAIARRVGVGKARPYWYGELAAERKRP
jgi:hypothetical protein